MSKPIYDSTTGEPLNQAAYEAEMNADMYCCEYGFNHPEKCAWWHQCQCFECKKCQHEEI